MPIYDIHEYGKPTWREDIVDVALMVLGLALLIIFTIVGVMFSDWLDGALYRMGFHSAPVSWIAHIVGFSATIGVVLTIGGRLTNGAFWWRT